MFSSVFPRFFGHYILQRKQAKPESRWGDRSGLYTISPKVSRFFTCSQRKKASQRETSFDGSVPVCAYVAMWLGVETKSNTRLHLRGLLYTL